MQTRYVLILLALLPFILAAQLEENFDGISVAELTQWSGDLEDFVINEEGRLQLNASQAGSSSISSPINLSANAEWRISFELDFAPSTSNQLKIYLFADEINLVASSGYFLEIGESGTEDNLKFYRQDNGSKFLVGEGTMSSLGGDPAASSIKVIKDANGIWSFFTAYGSDPLVQLEFELSDDEINLADGHFGIVCKYSETRKDKFFFDDIYVGEITQDTDPPILVSATLIDPNKIRLLFNELVLADVALDPTTFLIDNGIGNPKSVNFGDLDNELFLDIDPAAAEGVEYVLTIQDIEDLSGNRLTTDRDLFLSSIPTSGDLVINEILFDPNPGFEDFIELYNISDKYLSLKGMVIQNMENGRSEMIDEDLLLRPGQYLAITPDVGALGEEYNLLIPENIIEHKLPAWSNAGGNISLSLEGLSVLIDNFTYSEDLHSVWLDDPEGVSLERVDPYKDAGIDSNWQSASQRAGFATPGYINSNFSESEIVNNEFFIEKKTFSPDGDGFDDVLEIKYRVATAGSVLNMRIFDDRGHLTRTLATNEILSSVGSVIWDGIRDDGTLGKMGIYVIWLEYFDAEGSIGHKKLSCVLAKQLD